MLFNDSRLLSTSIQALGGREVCCNDRVWLKQSGLFYTDSPTAKSYA